MITAVIFDCFGVLSKGSLTYLASLAAPENRQEVYDCNKQADYGYITHEEHLERLAGLTGISVADVQDIFRSKHIVNRPLLQYVRSLRSQYKTALLSNVGHSIITTMFTEQELADAFDAVALSADIGAIKPSAEVYEVTAEKLGVPPEQCVMIDDIPRNVEGAELVGMKGILYTSDGQMIAHLKALLGPENA